VRNSTYALPARRQLQRADCGALRSLRICPAYSFGQGLNISAMPAFIHRSQLREISAGAGSHLQRLLTESARGVNSCTIDSPDFSMSAQVSKKSDLPS
jgi:hypothetical protein